MPQANLSLPDIADPRFRLVCEKLIEKMEALQVPGIAVGIFHEGLSYTAGLGVTHLENPLPVTSTTLFEIGSTTKTITALAAMRLVDQGLLSLDAPLCTHLPDLRLPTSQVTDEATLRHLLTHTGGWLGDHFPDCGFNDDALARYTATLGDIPQLTPLGEVFSYCNSGFILAGRVIEVVTGKGYEAAVRELVLDPLGLGSSFFFMHEVMHRRFATGHHNAPGTNQATPVEFWPVPRWAGPAGGLISTVHDQLAYARFLMGDGTASDGARLLKEETLAQMRAHQALAGGGLGESIGLGLIRRQIDGTQTLFHGGSINGQQSDFQMVPSRQFAYTLLTNADNGVLLHLQMAPIIYEAFLGLKVRQPTAIELSPEQTVEYLGVFKRTDGSTFTITPGEGGQIVVTMTPEAEPGTDDQPAPEVYHTRFIGADRLVITDTGIAGMLCDYVRDSDGQIAWFRESGRVARKAEPSS